MWKVEPRPDKVIIRHPSVPTSLVIKIKREIELVPRWRIVSSLVALSFVSGVALSHGRPVTAAVTGVVALFLAWAAGR